MDTPELLTVDQSIAQDFRTCVGPGPEQLQYCCQKLGNRNCRGIDRWDLDRWFWCSYDVHHVMHLGHIVSSFNDADNSGYSIADTDTIHYHEIWWTNMMIHGKMVWELRRLTAPVMQQRFPCSEDCRRQMAHSCVWLGTFGRASVYANLMLHLETRHSLPASLRVLAEDHKGDAVTWTFRSDSPWLSFSSLSHVVIEPPRLPRCNGHCRRSGSLEGPAWYLEHDGCLELKWFFGWRNRQKFHEEQNTCSSSSFSNRDIFWTHILEDEIESRGNWSLASGLYISVGDSKPKFTS